MTLEEWDAIEMVLEECWPGQWGANTGTAYRLLLGEFSAEAVVAAVRKVAITTGKFRPSGGELLEALVSDPSRPTWPEALREIRAVLDARPERRTFEDAGDRRRAYRAAAMERALAAHPLVGAFVARMGVDTLREFQLDHEVWGERVRANLQAEWDRHVEAFAERDAHSMALQLGGGEVEGLRRLAPLAALGLGRRELGEGL